MLRAVRSSGKALQLLTNASAQRSRVMGAVALPLRRCADAGFPGGGGGGSGSLMSVPVRSYSFFPGGPYGPQLPPQQQEGEAAPEEENKDGTSQTTDDFYDLPKGPTHKEMIAARRHYLKRQARRGLLPPSRPIRKPSF